MEKYGKNIVLFLLLAGMAPAVQAENEPSRESNEEYYVSDECCPRVAVIDFDNAVDLKKLEMRLLDLAKDKNIHGILLAVDHCGGGPEVGVIHDLIIRIKRIKPIVGLVRGVALSAGYHVASAADYLIAHTCSGVGSIGVWREIQRWDEKNVDAERNGLKAHARIYIFKAGKYKALERPCVGELSDEEKAYIQAGIDKDYEEFIAAVAHNRGLDIARSEDWAEGKTFTAAEALELGLIDEIGTAIEAEIMLIKLMRKRNPNKIISIDVRYVYS
jgi:protease-4